jgi:hypothetical protein
LYGHTECGITPSTEYTSIKPFKIKTKIVKPHQPGIRSTYKIIMVLLITALLKNPKSNNG